MRHLPVHLLHPLVIPFNHHFQGFIRQIIEDYHQVFAVDCQVEHLMPSQPPCLA